MRIAKDTESEIVIKMPIWFRVIAWLVLIIAAPFLLMFLLVGLVDANPETLIPGGFGLLFVLLGVWMVGMTTKVTFNEPKEVITVTNGHVPLYLWFLRTKIISKEEARTAFARRAKHDFLDAIDEAPTISYEVRVTTTSGKEVRLYEGRKAEVVDYLAKRIKDFALEPGQGR